MTKNTGFDLSSIDTIAACNKPFELEIKHPITEAKTGVFISVIGSDSDVYRSAIKAMADENMKRQAFAEQRGKSDIPNIDRLEKKNIDTLVAATVGWRNVMLDGEALEFSPANARKVYERILPVRQQVQAAINDLENFITG